MNRTAHTLFKLCKTAGAVVATSLLATMAHAQVAVVEDISDNNTSVELMDFVSEGDVISLGAGETMVLGYFESCARETITGGKVTIGAMKSTVDGGTVDTETVECDGGRMMLTLAEAAVSGVAVTRGQPEGELKPSFTLYGSSPIVKTMGQKRIIFERLDEKGFVMIVPTEGKAVIDMASLQLSLIPGATYRAKAGKLHKVIFAVTEDAKAGAGPALGRLVQFGG